MESQSFFQAKSQAKICSIGSPPCPLGVTDSCRNKGYQFSNLYVTKSITFDITYSRRKNITVCLSHKTGWHREHSVLLNALERQEVWLG